MPTEYDKLAEWMALDAERKELETRLKELQAKDGPIARLEKQILEQWASDGTKNVSRNGRTVYVRSDFVCSKRSDVSTETVCEVLAAEGFGNIVKLNYNAQSLKSRIKELSEEDQVPASLDRVLNYDTIMRLVAVKSG